MKQTFILALIVSLGVCAFGNDNIGRQQHKKSGSSYSKWILRTTDSEFFATEDARRIGEQVLLWQRNTGGWPKNIDMVTPMTNEQKQSVLNDKARRDDSTTDNDATTVQMIFLARLYRATGDTIYRNSFRAGLDYLLSGQYENGGWPQFWPEQRDYQPHITYNDNAMVNTLSLIRDICDGGSPFDSDLCDDVSKKKMAQAFNKGIECILATQIITDGKPTVWCQQHDRITLQPAKARAYELPSYCSQESASIVRLLMQLPNPDNRIKAAVDGAMAWFAEHKLTGVKCRRTMTDNGKFNTELIRTNNPDDVTWARFYDLQNGEPFVCDRDGIPRKDISELSSERRNGYAWYGERPAELYDMYEKWSERWFNGNNK